jgi:hypothetical protein
MDRRTAFLFIVILVFMISFLVLRKIDIISKPNKDINTYIKPANPSPITIITDKPVYESGEPIQINVTRGDFPSADEPYLEVGSCYLQINRGQKISRDGGVSIETPINTIVGVNRQGDENFTNYVWRYDFEVNKSSTATIRLSQRMLENSFIIQTIPDVYNIEVDCFLADHRGSSWEGIYYTSIHASSGFKINEPVSCRGKRINITYAAYASNNSVIVRIKNTGNEKVDTIGIYMDICRRGNTKTSHGQPTHVIVNGLVAGETEDFMVKPRDHCQYWFVSAHVYECDDENPESWSEEDIGYSQN